MSEKDEHRAPSKSPSQRYPDLRSVPAVLRMGNLERVVQVLRTEFDLLGGEDLKIAIREAGLSDLTGVAEKRWLSVAEADIEANAMFNLAAGLWEAGQYDDVATNAMRLAAEMGAPNATIELAKYLMWLRNDEEAERLLRYLEVNSPSGEASGLLGRLYFENMGRKGKRVVSLLAKNLGEPQTDIAFSKILIERGEFDEARAFLEERSQEGHVWAPLLLGNLYKDQIQDPLAAERAYARGVELGDVHSATNLGILLLGSGDRSRAVPLLKQAQSAGDELAARVMREAAVERAAP